MQLTKKSSGQFKASRFLQSKKACLFKLRADFGVIRATPLSLRGADNAELS